MNWMCSVSWAQVRCSHWDPTRWHCSPSPTLQKPQMPSWNFTVPFISAYHSASTYPVVPTRMSLPDLQEWKKLQKGGRCSEGEGESRDLQEALWGRSCSTETLILCCGRGTCESSICWLPRATERHQECLQQPPVHVFNMKNITSQQDFF